MRAQDAATALEPSGEQLAAARAGPAGAFLIAAGPGTGKTFTMVERFTWLVEEGRVPCDRILTVTFTEKAAAELKERITERLGETGAVTPAAMESAWIGTFHGVCARLLEENAYLVGAPRELRVLDDLGQRLLVESLRARLLSGAEAGVDLDALAALGPDDVSDLLRHGLSFVLKLKGRGIDASGFRGRALELHHQNWLDLHADLTARAEEEAITILHAVFAAYERELERRGLLDFDDLILRVIRALKTVPGFRAWCQDRFRYIVVDEFQDTNAIQLELVRLLSQDGEEDRGFANVAAVGDAKQSIYGWRDAEIENIRSRFPGRHLPLTINRRSVQEILDCATSLIRRDPGFADEPDLVAARGAGGRAVTLMMAPDPQREARMVAGEIRRLQEQGLRLSEIAILATSVRHLPPEFEQELRIHGIPYLTAGGAGFFDREEVKDVVALLRLAEDPLDDGALVRVLQGPVVRLGDEGMYQVAVRRAGRRGMRLRDCWVESAATGHLGLDPHVVGRAERVLAAVDSVGAARDGMSVAEVLDRLLQTTGYLRHAQLRALREGPRPIRNLRQVFQMASRFQADATLAGMGGFVRHLDQMMAAEASVAETAERSEAVSLLTVHTAKGLEWKAVFLVETRPAVVRDSERFFFDPEEAGFVMKRWSGSRDGRHPRYALTSASAPALELARAERRRVIYVALTRAADRLYVCASRLEASADEVALGGREDDYFAEILSWALANPDAARIMESEQLELPRLEPTPSRDPGASAGALAVVAERLERLLTLPPPDSGERARQVTLSFSQLQQFELCPLRYRYQEVWQVPVPPDELLPVAATSRGAFLGAAIHEALRAYHDPAGPPGQDLLALFEDRARAHALAAEAGQEGEAMLERYLRRPLAQAPTLGTELQFNLRLGQVLVRGFVDRVCLLEGRTVLLDYKTNRSLDNALLAAYTTQLRLYAVAAGQGLLPGGDSPRLILLDLRRDREVTVEPASEEVVGRTERAARAIAEGRFELGPEHAQRPCHACSYRPLCPSAR